MKENNKEIITIKLTREEIKEIELSLLSHRIILQNLLERAVTQDKEEYQKKLQNNLSADKKMKGALYE